MKHYFLNLETSLAGPGNQWMDISRHQTYIHSTGTYNIRYVPREQFDGILYIDTVSRPTFLN